MRFWPESMRFWPESVTSFAVRVVLFLLSTWAAAALAPAIDLPQSVGALGGAVLALLAMWLETRAAGVPVERLFWGSLGGFFGLIAGLAIGAAAVSLIPNAGMAGFGLPALLGAYLGAAVALRRRADLEPVSAVLFPGGRGRGDGRKILDTSVIIDGRIADIGETGFVEGTLVVPQFVLQELQRIADAPDPLRRARGKRGFEVLERLRRVPKLKVEVIERDFPQVPEVDGKLLELARSLSAKVLTNDANLNRVAQLRGIEVLNVNELASALKPVALPGEPMRILVVREGKEAGQGVAYLDDGTMVVVDGGRKHLGQMVDVVVTSVLQTTAGRMIFTRPRDDATVSKVRHG
jgi:uncharacterized protein YacL